jgi:thiopurine S-methyltransferase
VTEEWLQRWASGRTGWHEAGGNAGLRRHWRAKGGTVLVPLCGKTPDLRWLADRGHRVVGVELSEIAAQEFFAEQGLSCNRHDAGPFVRYEATDAAVTIYCGDYFEFDAGPFDALYDRGALVAIDPDQRRRYAAHTRQLLGPDGPRLIVTLEYEQAVVAGPPFSVLPDELLEYWPGLSRVAEKDDFDTCPPKFREAGLKEISEVVWYSD